MIIQNGIVYTEQGRFEQRTIGIAAGRFTESESLDENEQILDASNCFIIPGLIDLHFHGCVGYDFCDGNIDAIRHMAEYEASQGITTICPATMTIPTEQLLKICDAARDYDSATGANLVGINMEGPFISEVKKGAQRKEDIQKPDLKIYQEMQRQSGNLIKILDIAPEVEGAMELIQKVKDEVVISLAHTDADYDTACAAFVNGASHVTHLYNAMQPYHHRNPGVIGAAADCEQCQVELICDGVHVHPNVIRNTYRIFGRERIILISDSMMATGMPDGQYWLGGQKVYVKGNLAELADGTVAGSVTNLMDCLRFCVEHAGIPLEDAVYSATISPAKSLNIEQEYGSITPGKIANFVILDENLERKAVYMNGKLI